MPLKKCKRWESEATRRRRAALAKYRQGLNGKWESNAKKAIARKVKQKSLRTGPMLAQCKAVQDAYDAQNLAKAQKLVEALKEANQATLEELVPQLESLKVTGMLLRRTLIPKVLRESASKFPSIKSKVTPIIQRWRAIFVEEKQTLSKDKKEASSRPKISEKHKPQIPDVELVLPEVMRTPPPRLQKPQKKQKRITLFMKKQGEVSV
ncbi:unnamed protein product [Symbiodinium pilosum]|uniref:TFIIS N-terminal domain-containing protein n=1 Tax=Symbiodinium pilosum TaxID=2952 RepID=A0A812JU52_SYMPI|nr:unnamed protein product [Symbiodinium pilosum]